jgi:type IV pilus assembly protein PilA
MQNKKTMSAGRSGFTLLEILLVVAAIAILAGIVIVAINPGKQLGDTRNAQRQSNVSTILNAVYQYTIDNNGVMPTIPAIATEVCSTTGAACTAAGFVDLGVLIASQKYITAIPTDPQCATTDSSCYTISKSANGRIAVEALIPENGAVISVSK